MKQHIRTRFLENVSAWRIQPGDMLSFTHAPIALVYATTHKITLRGNNVTLYLILSDGDLTVSKCGFEEVVHNVLRLERL